MDLTVAAQVATYFTLVLTGYSASPESKLVAKLLNLKTMSTVKTQQKNEFKPKTYVLLEHTKPAANVYIQVSANQRTRINARRLDAPYRQISFTDYDGTHRTIRLKLNAQSIYQDAQIKAGIPANEKFTQKEAEAVCFRHGVLVVKNKIIQEFLDNHPQNEAFWNPDKDGRVRYCEDIRQPLFKEYDRTVEIKEENKTTRRRVKAGSKIFDLSLEEAQDMLVRLNGSFFKAPDDLEECQNQLIAWLDNADDEGVEMILRDKDDADEKALVVITRAVKEGIISFDEKPGTVQKIVNKENPLTLKEIPDFAMANDQYRYFAEFLVSDAGKDVYSDLKEELEKKKPAKKN